MAFVQGLFQNQLVFGLPERLQTESRTFLKAFVSHSALKAL